MVTNAVDTDSHESAEDGIASGTKELSKWLQRLITAMIYFKDFCVWVVRTVITWIHTFFENTRIQNETDMLRIPAKLESIPLSIVREISHVKKKLEAGIISKPEAMMIVIARVNEGETRMHSAIVHEYRAAIEKAHALSMKMRKTQTENTIKFLTAVTVVTWSHAPVRVDPVKVLRGEMSRMCMPPILPFGVTYSTLCHRVAFTAVVMFTVHHVFKMTGPRERQKEDDKNEETSKQENKKEPEDYDESNDESNDIMPVTRLWFEPMDDGVICCANLLKKK